MRPRWLLALALVSCSTPQDTERVPLLDRATFERDVQPVLASRCANPTCHGRPERALSVYAPLQWRADPLRTHLPEALTPQELDHNYAASCALAALPSADENALLARKPLGDAGGLYHGGGAVFDGPTDASYRTIAAWIARGGGP